MGDFFQDVVGSGGPDEGLGILIVVIDIFTNGHDELLKIAENATAYTFLGQVAEETFNHVQPGGGSRREGDVKPLVPVQPSLDALMFVCRVVVADDMNVLVPGDNYHPDSSGQHAP